MSLPRRTRLRRKSSKASVHRLVGHHAMKGKAQFAADGFHTLAVFAQTALVGRAGRRRINVNVALALDVLKEHRVLEIEGQFIGIEHLENDHSCPAAEAGQVALQFAHRREQIGDKHDQSPFARQFGHAAQRFGQVGGAARRFPFQRQHELAQVPVPMPRGQIIAHALVERRTARPRRPARAGTTPAWRRRCGRSPIWNKPASRNHGAAVIDQQMAAEVGFVLELFEIKAVGTGVETPVQVAGVLAGRVGPVFGELDGETVIRTAMQAAPETFDDNPARNSRFRIAISALGSTKPGMLSPVRRILAGRGCWNSTSRHNQLGISNCSSPGPQDAPGSLTVSSKRRMTASTLVPSASAR
jgi:hypothetical protein